MFWRWTLVLAIGVVLLYTYSRWMPFNPELNEINIIEAARNMSQGRGLVTRVGQPGVLPYYKDPTPPFPYLSYPLVPIVTSGLFAVFGVQPRLVVIFPMAMYLLSGIAVFELGRRVFNPLTGVLAALVLLAQPLMIETAAREQFTDPVLVGLLVSAVLCVFAASDDTARRPIAWLIASGVLVGLCQWARYAALMLFGPMPLLVAMASPRSSRVMRVSVLLGACLVTMLPLFIWNLRHIGSLTFTPRYVFLFLTPSFPSQSSILAVLPADFPVFQQHGREVFLKWASQVWVHYKYFFEITSPLLLVGAMLLGFGAIPWRQRALWTFTLALYLAMVFFNSWFQWENRYLLPVVPFVAILGVEFVRATLAAMPVPPVVRTGAAAMLALVVLSEPIDSFYQLAKVRPRNPPPVSKPDERVSFMKAYLRPDDVVMSFDAPIIAWETGNVALGLPLSPEKAALVADRYVRFNTLLLETRRPRADLFGVSEDWYQIARGAKTFRDFEIEQSTALPPDQNLVLLRSKASP
jgi:4-amino-4-deoxy-L-arabinose transferase-like glycosyltransferase